jgi:uncharacterized protein YndB with AHSA1/START domain
MATETDPTLIARQSIAINATPDAIYQAITTPSVISKFLFGTKVTSDFQPGSPITWEGEWQGKTYQDKGMILEAIPGKLLEHTYWSSNTGKPDTPDNYKHVGYEIEAMSMDTTLLTIIQDNNEDEKERDHAEKNWNKVLEGIKKVVEG